MWIRFFLTGFCALVSAAVSFSPSIAQQDDRDIRQLRLDTNAAISRSKSAVDGALTASIIDLCSLHHELVTHERFATSRVLAGARARIASRLEDLRRVIEKDLEKAGEPESMDLEKYGQSRLKDRLMSQHIRITGAQIGGPAYEGLALTGNFAAGDEWGLELVNLIQQTINPDNWQSRGGDAVIVYWAPTQSLVISANTMTHEKVESLLTGLRGR